MSTNDQSVEPPIIQFSPELYPAPPVVDGGSITATSLRQLLNAGAEGKQRVDILHSLGNIELREGSPEEAKRYFEEALSIAENSPELQINLGIALFFCGEFADATLQLKKAQLLNPALILGHLYRGRIAVKIGNTAEAIAAYERVLAAQPENREALSVLAHSHQVRGDVDTAREHYQTLLAAEPKDIKAQEALALNDFRRGEQEFKNGDIERACSIWGESYAKWPRPFISNAELHREFRSLVDSYRQQSRFDEDIRNYQSAFRNDPNNQEIIFPLVQRFLFVEGLMPEAHEERALLAESEQRWRKSIEERGEHPYPHFRFALIHLYRGDLELALNELTVCQDRFPPKKQRALKIAELTRFAKQLIEIHQRKDEYVNLGRSVDEWAEAGFTDPFQLRPWKESGLAPADAAQWRDAKFQPKAAYQWQKVGVSTEDAHLWIEAGFEEPRIAKNWIRGGFTPSEAKDWEQRCPLTQEMTIQCRKAGFEDPALAYQWMQVLTFPLEAIQWHELGFTPDETILWRDSGFTEPNQAQEFKSKGLTPDEAVREYSQRN